MHTQSTSMVVKTSSFSCYFLFVSCCNNSPHLLLLLLLPPFTPSSSWLPIIAHAQDTDDPHAGWSRYSSNPSVDGPWSLSDYYNTSDEKFSYKYGDFTMCNNMSNLALLNDEQGLYGRCTQIYSAHALDTVPYSVYFGLCFVIPLEGVCLRKRNPTIAAYQLAVMALNSNGKLQDPNKGQVIWTANTERLVSENACVHLGEDSNLKLMENDEVVWQTNTTGKAVNASLIFSFEGNLILVSNTTGPYPAYIRLWQSFGSPTDALMVLQVLQKPNILRSRYVNLSNSSESSSPAANYTMVIGEGGLVLYARIWERDASPYGSPYWVSSNRSTGTIDSTAAPHDEISFGALCWASGNQLDISVGSNRSNDFTAISPANCSSIQPNAKLMLGTPDANRTNNVTYATFMRLETDGDLRVYTVRNTTYTTNATWEHFYSVFNDTPCQLPLYCGFYGKCDQEGKEEGNCTCMAGFEFADASSHQSGCKLDNGSDEQTQLPIDGSMCAISENEKVAFKTLHSVDYFAIQFTYLQNLSSKEPADDSSCRENCRNDCNCTAAFWNRSSSTCFLVRGPVATIRTGTMEAYIKYLIITNPATSRKHWNVFGPLLAAAAVSLVMASIYLYQRRKALQKRSAEREQESLLLSLLGSDSPSRFTWKQMHEYTCGFSDNLGGGGFGCVFRGALPDGTAIAVKQLDEDRSYGQGNKEFIAEVSILSRIHHAHLVRLIGFCLEGTHRLLVYEFMENGSLDRWLFKARRAVQETEDGKKSNRRRETLLPWKVRFQIALGTSKGLAYLHEECEERVIHMDLKPQNILLGRDFAPKISDFGMSRRIAREQTSVMTVMRGTPGYLAPEWLLDGAVTEKCDVYCFGIVLLEIVSGRRVAWKEARALRRRLQLVGTGISQQKESANAIEGFVDQKLELRYGSGIAKNGVIVVMEEAVRMVEIALLCVQTDPAKRPAMSSVALMLEGKMEVQKRVASLADDDDDDGDDEEEDGYGGRERLSLMHHQGSVPLTTRKSKSLGSFAAAGDGSGSFSTRSNMWWSSSSSHSSAAMNSSRKYMSSTRTNHLNDDSTSNSGSGNKKDEGAISESSTLLHHWSTYV